MDVVSDVGTPVGADPGDAQQARLARKKERKKERKKRWKQRRSERKEADEEEGDEDDDGEWDPDSDLAAVMLKQDLPACAPAACGAVGVEYTRRMAAVAESGGYVSLGTFRKLDSLLLECESALTSRGVDATTLYAEPAAVRLRIVLSDDSLPRRFKGPSAEDAGGSDDDVELYC